MKYLFRLVIAAILGFVLSFSLHALPRVSAQQLSQNQNSALSLVQVGKQHYDAGQFSDAAKVLQQAAQVYQSVGEVLQQAQALNWMSLALQKLGQWQEAEAAIHSSLSLLQTVPDGQVRSQVHAQVLNTQGRLQLTRGDAETALKTWQNAEALYTQAGDAVGVLGSQINQAEAMQALGFYRRAEKLLAQVEQKLLDSTDSPLKVAAFHNLGNLLRQDGDLERSKSILELGLTIAQRLREAKPSSVQESPQDESQLLLSLGNTERAFVRRAQVLNNAKDANKHTQDALTYYQQATTTATLPITRIQAQLNQLSLLLETNQIASAQTLGLQISGEVSSLPASRASVYAGVNLVQNLMKIGNWEKVVSKDISQILERTVQQAQHLEDKRAESYALGALGNFYEKTADWPNAKNFTEKALLIAQQLNAPDMAYQWQWQIGRLLQAQAEQTTTSREADTEAIAYYTQAFKTLNTLRSDLVALNRDVQFSFRESVEPVYRQLVDLLLRAEQPSKHNLIQARNVIEALQLAELDNFFRDACAKPEAVNIDNLAQTAAVIYPIILSDRLEVILKLPQPDNLRRYAHYDVSEAQVDKAVNQFRTSLTRRSTSLSQLKKESQQLYNWLIAPFETELESASAREQSRIKTLVFVLDGSLRNIPLAALYNGKRFLVERYAMAVTPGLQLLDPKPLPQENMNVLIAGATNAPSFEKEGFGPLDSVKTELENIEEEVRHTQKLENQRFLQQNIQNQINSGHFSVVHLATHGTFSSNPEQTFLLDWSDRIKVNDLEQLLRTSNPSTATPIELLILSACETATGDKRAALGLAGVAIRAGARSTLATLWQVNDASTAEFMIQFYKQLKNPQVTKAEALRNTQNAFLTQYPNTDYNRPYFWAPFILIGNWL